MAAMVAPERDEPWATASKFVALGFADASVERLAHLRHSFTG